MTCGFWSASTASGLMMDDGDFMLFLLVILLTIPGIVLSAILIGIGGRREELRGRSLVFGVIGGAYALFELAVFHGSSAEPYTLILLGQSLLLAYQVIRGLTASSKLRRLAFLGILAFVVALNIPAPKLIDISPQPIIENYGEFSPGRWTTQPEPRTLRAEGVPDLFVVRYLETARSCGHRPLVQQTSTPGVYELSELRDRHPRSSRPDTFLRLPFAERAPQLQFHLSPCALAVSASGPRELFGELLFRLIEDADSIAAYNELSPRVMRIRELIATGQPLDYREPATGRTSLMQALAHDYGDVSRWLIEKGANVLGQDAEGNTPLHYAVNRSPDIVKLLLQQGANPVAVNNRGKTPEDCMKTPCIRDARIWFSAPADDEEIRGYLVQAVES